MKIQDAKTIMHSDLIMLKLSYQPELNIQVKAMETLMNYLEKLETENSQLKAKVMIKEMPGGSE